VTKLLTVLVLTILTSFAAYSQEMITDRPDFTESAIVVPIKSVQFELGTGFQRSQDVDEMQYPNMLARIGLHDRFELRLGLPGWTTMEIADQSKTYFQDVYVEGKLQMTPDDAVLPMAIILAATAPTGDDIVSTGKSEFGVKYAIAYDFSDRISLGANVGLFSRAETEDRILSSLASVAVGVSVTQRVGLFFETFAEMPENASWSPVFDAGVTFLATPLLQFDVAFGLGLNSFAVDHFIGLGVSFRI
jgi:hypothetical protein